MQVQFWGAAGEVTGSMHLVRARGRNILLDCGLLQGRRQIAFERNRNLPFDAREIDAVILSHAHIDHSGNLPSLVRAGYTGPIYATPATRDLCAYMLQDSAHIQEHDVRYVNKRRRKKGQRPFEPLYTAEDAIATLEQFVTIAFYRPFRVFEGIEAELHVAGHIFGAASVSLDLREEGRELRLVFSGDIGRQGMPIVPDPEIVAGADAVIMESTYGLRSHESSGAAKEVLGRLVRQKWEDGGKLLIPAFAVGRTQEILYRLNQLYEEGRLPAIDVYVDSPLAINVTEVLRLHPEIYDAEMRRALVEDSDGDPLGFPRLRFTRRAEESMVLNTLEGPAVIISASGMCEGGRILHHLKNHIGEESTHLLFVGFQAEHTLGRRLLEGSNPVRIFGEEHEVRATVGKIDGYSAHADREGLIDWAVRTRDAGSPRRVFLVHGEPESSAALAEALEAEGMQGVKRPVRGQIFPL